MVAHINPFTGEKQMVEEHCRNTAVKAEKFGIEINVPNVAHLAGLFHDFGKLTNKFANYIEKAFKRTSIDTLGSKFITC